MINITLYPEICCEECDSVIHNHFDCPVCKKQNAGTSIYSEYDRQFDAEFSCENCGSLFEVHGEGQYYNEIIVSVKIDKFNK